MDYFKKPSSNQHYALVVLVASLVYGILGLMMEEGFFSDPVGPNLWIQGVAAILFVLSLLLLVFPTSFVGSFPSLQEWLLRIPFLLVIIAYSYALPLFGFAISTPILMALIGILFKARLVPAIVSGLLMTVGCFIVFDFALGISLPMGLLFR